jgi:ribosome assembly protein YihI (activator of Der GTPase)
MTEKTIQLNLTEEQFNIIWNAMVLSVDEMVDEGDIRVFDETLNEMEDIMEKLGLEVFGDVDDD